MTQADNRESGGVGVGERAADKAVANTASAAERTADDAVAKAASAAKRAAAHLAAAPIATIDAALRAMAAGLATTAEAVLDANRLDVGAARSAGMGGGQLDRLRLDPARLAAIAEQLLALADIPAGPPRSRVRDLPGGLVLEEWRRPVGVIGANFEARPNVVIDIASQLVKSRNAGVLRTGTAALGSASALVDRVVAPALAGVGLDAGAIQLVRLAGHDSAAALVRQPTLIPLVILRGSGESTRRLTELGALNGVRTLAHADGGGVLYLDRSADRTLAMQVIEGSLDRLGVCNRLNLLLVDQSIWDEVVPTVPARLAELEPTVAVSLPPHDHPLGLEWALVPGREATVTLAMVDGPSEAARVANELTSGLAAGIIADDASAAAAFLSAYAGTGGFWNATSRLLDGFKLFSVPETGINIDRVPGPRGPVTFRDLYLRQYVVVPAERAAELG
jgi:glutamate-5-semialdehyde dehydrogenase